MCTLLSEAQNHKCCLCGVVMFLPYPMKDALHPKTALAIKISHNKASIEHVVPLSRGGTDDWDNLAASCVDCNNKKGDSILEL